MLKLNDDGTVTIDDFESAQGDPMTVTIRPPRVGALKRIRVDLRKIEADEALFVANLNDEGETTLREKRELQRDWWEERLTAWWTIILRGDDTFRALTTDQVPEPDGWPNYLLYVKCVAQVIAHWQSVPLARGDLPTLMEPVSD